MDRSWPGEKARPFEPIERNVAEMPLIDPHANRGTAVAVRGQGIELAGTSPIAIAGRELGTSDTPIDKGHDHPSFSRPRYNTVFIPYPIARWIAPSGDRQASKTRLVSHAPLGPG